MRRALLVLLFLGVALTTRAQVAQAASAAQQVAPSAAAQMPDEAAIRAALEAQVAAWNRADIPAFMQTYENSPETTFIGAHLRKGYGPILERYKENYTTAEQMGVLTFKETVLAEGHAAQTNTLRWEDYASTAMDPSDDCTFWYVGDYIKSTGASYSTRIGGFRLPGCSSKHWGIF